MRALILFGWLTLLCAGTLTPMAAQAGPLDDLLHGRAGMGSSTYDNDRKYNNIPRDAFLYFFRPRIVAINELRDTMFMPEHMQNTPVQWRGQLDRIPVWGTITVTGTERESGKVCRRFIVTVNWQQNSYDSRRVTRYHNSGSVSGKGCLAQNDQGMQFWAIRNNDFW